MSQRYEFIVRGTVSRCLLAELPGFDADYVDGDTHLVGMVRDHAELEGVAARLRDSGYVLVSMTPTTGRT